MEDVKVYIGYIARVIEAIGVAAIVFGVLIALIRFIFTLQHLKPRSYKMLRQELGKGILLGLEILVAGDIIATVVTEPTMERVLILAVIVLIRTFLSLSIEVEIEGKFPWKNGPAPPRTLDQA
ncbi:MAG: DUF1622 domain-containing protein [Flavobacteriales bacterium]